MTGAARAGLTVLRASDKEIIHLRLALTVAQRL